MNWMQSLQAEIYREVEEDAAEYLGENKQTLPRFDLDLLDGAPPPDRKWVLPGFIPCGEITLFTGPGGAGKSLFAQQLATALAGGVPFLGIGASGEKTTIGILLSRHKATALASMTLRSSANTLP